jgi:hypothetical protein
MKYSNQDQALAAMLTVFIGNVVHSRSISDLELLQAAVVVDCKTGRILALDRDASSERYQGPQYTVHVMEVPRQVLGALAVTLAAG